ncbi:hypothetical protein [Streptomyces triticagri]
MRVCGNRTKARRYTARRVGGGGYGGGDSPASYGS